MVMGKKEKCRQVQKMEHIEFNIKYPVDVNLLLGLVPHQMDESTKVYSCH